MSAADAYSTSGGWSGGSALNAGGVLSNYYQKLQSVDPTSGSLTAAQPAQPSTQPSSLSRVATTTPATQTAAAPTTQATQALPTIAAVPVIASAVQPASSRVATPAATPVTTQASTAQPTATPATTSAATSPVNFGADGINAPLWSTPKASTSYTIGGVTYHPYDQTDPAYTTQLAIPSVTITANDGKTYSVAFNKGDGAWSVTQSGNYPTQKDPTTGQLIQENFGQQNVAPTKQALVAAVLGKYGTQFNTYVQAVSAAKQTAFQKQQDTDAQTAATQAADQATAFNLSNALQAPNTTDIDQGGANDLARVRSMYSSGLGGADAAAYNYAGQGALGTQAAVNAVNHNTAYANAFDSNYTTFANALAQRQTADANATGQKLQYDIQGVNDAVNQLEQASTQLSTGTRTKFETQLTGLKQQLAQYQIAHDQYGASSSQALALAQTVLSGAASLGSLVPAL